MIEENERFGKRISQDLCITSKFDGTFDVSILRIGQGNVQILATGDNTHLNGNDFDIRLANHLCEDFRSRSGKEIGENRETRQRLRVEACKSKQHLSFVQRTRITIHYLFEDSHHSGIVNRAVFEQLSEDLFQATIAIVEKTLGDAKIDRSTRFCL